MAQVDFSLEAIIGSGPPEINEEQQIQEECFNASVEDGKEYISEAGFSTLLKKLFRNSISGKAYDINEEQKKELFRRFDVNDDDRIDRIEFSGLWRKWMKTILWPKAALLVVDVQNDFISGSLALSKCSANQKGEDVIPVINRLQEEVPFSEVFYSQDWHPIDHISFIENAKKRKILEINGKPVNVSQISVNGVERNSHPQVFDTVMYDGSPKIVQKLWPSHCVQKTEGAALHADLKIKPNATKVFKGTDPLIDSYSVFWDNARQKSTMLHEELQRKHITDLYICGIAFDVCVTYTAKDAVQHGYRTVIIEDACRGIEEQDICKCKKELSELSCVIVNADAVSHMVSGYDRRPELGYILAAKDIPCL